jgi:DNA polymerase-3 subunit delta'
MLDKYLESQKVSTILLKKALENNKVVQAYLFFSENIDYTMNYAKDFAKEIICDGQNQDICNKIDNDSYPELKIVSPDGNFIKKEQLVELQNSVMNKPVLGKKIVYIIKNCEKLNQSSANSILKFLEEPADDIVALLLTDNLSNVITTIKSRCQVINLNNVVEQENYKTTIDYLYLLLGNDDILKEKFESLINYTLEFINAIESQKINVFINEKKFLFERYTDSSLINIFLNLLIYFYMDILYQKSGGNIKYFIDYEYDIINISEKNDINKILNKIYIFERLKNEVNYNVNSKLLFDKLIMEVGAL